MAQGTQVARLSNELQERYGLAVDSFIACYKNGDTAEEILTELDTTIHVIRIYAATLNLRLAKKYRNGDLALYLTRFDESADSKLTVELIEAENSLEHLSKQLVSRERQLASMKAEISKYRRAALVDTVTLQDVLDAVTTPSTGIPKVTPDTNIAHPRNLYSQLLVLSDLHVEECVSRDDLGQANEYNWEIMEERLAKVFATVNSTYNNEGTLIVGILGDTISGIIHSTQESATKPVVKALSDLAKLLAYHLNNLWASGRYRQILVPCVVGNHGRISEEKKSNAAGFNFEHLLYQLIDAMTVPEILLEISTNGLVMVGTIGMHHGDYFRFSSDTKYLKIKEAFKQVIGVEPTTIIQGHTHVFSVEEMPRGGKYITNASLIGANSYSHTNGFVGKNWGQVLLTIDPMESVDTIRLIQ